MNMVLIGAATGAVSGLLSYGIVRYGAGVSSTKALYWLVGVQAAAGAAVALLRAR